MKLHLAIYIDCSLNLYKYNLCIEYTRMRKKKKLKDEFKEFRNNDKSVYKTFKIPLKSILQNRDLVQPVINNLVFEMNDLVIHTYQFIRLYVIACYSNKTDLPVIDDTFILYCLKVLGTRDVRGRQMVNVGKFRNFLHYRISTIVKPRENQFEKQDISITIFSNANPYIIIKQRTRTVHSTFFAFRK